MNKDYDVKRKRNPKERAGLLSRTTFAYMFGLYKRGYKNDLDEHDMYDVVSKLNAKDLGDKLEKYWLRETLNKKQPSIVNALFACFGKVYLVLIIMQLLVEFIFLLLSPWVMQKFIFYFTANQTTMSKTEAYIYGYALVVLNIFQNLVQAHLYFYEQEFGVGITKSVSSLIYRKVLRLTGTELNDNTTGRILTVLTKDVESIQKFIISFSGGIITVMELLVVFYVIYANIGNTSLVGFSIIIVWIPIQVLLAKLIYNQRGKTCRVTDKRLQMTKECISYIRIIKMYTWEKFFTRKITEVRLKELQPLRWTHILQSLTTCLGQLFSKSATLVTIKTYELFGHVWTTDLLYYITGYFTKFVFYIGIMVPWTTSRFAFFWVSIGRINKFLTANEIKSILKHNFSTDTSITFDSVMVTINSQEVLKNITLEMKPGLNILTGYVGSGKSSLIKTILREYDITAGDMEVHGLISYASQDPWLFPSSIKQNILFGQRYDKSRYETVLQACALNYDISGFLDGDNTLINDKGENLSKGQQCRINLARALYRESDIYLLDDCLAAVDNRVKAKIFQGCMNFFKNKLCVFVTNDPKLLFYADKVILMKNGTNTTSVSSTEAFANNYDEDESTKSEKNLHEEQKEKQEPKKAIYYEKKKEGKIQISTYKKYIQFGGGFLFLFLVAIFSFGAESADKASEKLMSQWINNEEKIHNNKSLNASTIEMHNETTTYCYFCAYAAVNLSSELFTMVHATLFYIFSINASKEAHRQMVKSLVGAVPSFFDSHMNGIILNRFSSDLHSIDEEILHTTRNCFGLVFSLISLLILISTVDIMFLGFSFMLSLTFILVGHLALPASRSLQRLEAAAVSPIVGHLSTTFDGLTSIRAFGAQQVLKDEFDNHLNYHTSVLHSNMAASRGLSIFMQWFSNLFMMAIISRFLVPAKSNLAGDVGMVIGQVISISSLLEWAIRQYIFLEKEMAFVERALEYTNLEQENLTDQKSEINWPRNGQIVFNNVCLFYRKNEIVLRDLNFTIKPKEKIGVVGRTGTGKSSIISALFRLYEAEGTITIDNVDINKISLELLRRKISIIPQDAHLFEGSIRENLDPFNDYSDVDVWNALNSVSLKPFIRNLTDQVANQQFTLGQKQLICLARCILRKSTIVVLDEATANMDKSMDHFVQNKVEEIFKNCTIITVAHRLHNVMNCDRVMVLDDGCIVEFDAPKVLLDNKSSTFYRMVHN